MLPLQDHFIKTRLHKLNRLKVSWNFSQDSKTNTIFIALSGIGEACVYWYSDDTSTVYLCNLNVYPAHTKKGFGKELQTLREDIGRNLQAKHSCLWVQKNTWMHEWYKRRGYSDLKDHSTKGYIWMIKQL